MKFSNSSIWRAVPASSESIWDLHLNSQLRPISCTKDMLLMKVNNITINGWIVIQDILCIALNSVEPLLAYTWHLIVLWAECNALNIKACIIRKEQWLNSSTCQIYCKGIGKLDFRCGRQKYYIKSWFAYMSIHILNGLKHGGWKQATR